MNHFATVFLSSIVAANAYAATLNTGDNISWYNAQASAPTIKTITRKFDLSNHQLIDNNVIFAHQSEFISQGAGIEVTHSMSCMYSCESMEANLDTDITNNVLTLTLTFTDNINEISQEYGGSYNITINYENNVSLSVFDDSLNFGASNYLFTGDGGQNQSWPYFESTSAKSGSKALEVYTQQDPAYGSHWKIMLFANGNAAAYNGIDLSAYSHIGFWAKASQSNIKLNGAFGTDDDTGKKFFDQINLSTEYQYYELDISSLDKSDINTFAWLYLHKNENPTSWAGLSIYIDDVKLLKGGTLPEILGNFNASDTGVHPYYSEAQSFSAQGTITQVEVYFDTPQGWPWSLYILDDLPNSGYWGEVDQADLNTKVLRKLTVPAYSSGWISLPLETPLAVNYGTYYLFKNSYMVDGPHEARWAHSTPFPDYTIEPFRGFGYVHDYSWDSGYFAGNWHNKAFKVYIEESITQ